MRVPQKKDVYSLPKAENTEKKDADKEAKEQLQSMDFGNILGGDVEPEQNDLVEKAQNEQLKLSLHRLQKSYQQNNHMSSEENHPENPNNDTSLITERDSLAAKLEEQKKLTADTIHQMKEQQKKLIKLNQFCEEMDASNQEIADRIAAKFQAKIALLESELSHKSMQNKKMHEQLLHFKGVANLV